MKKLVDRDKLLEFSHMLENLYEAAPDINMKLLVSDLQLYYKLHILDITHEGINEIKREIYKKIKNSPDEKTRKVYHDMYKTLKEEK